MNKSLISLLFYFLIFKDSNGHRFKRLVGGIDTKIEEVNYMASIRTYNYHICGGAIISSKHILTAAHCLYKMFEYPFDDLQVVTGTSTLDQSGTYHKVFNVTCHPNYQEGQEDSWQNDIAIITLKKEIDENLCQKRAKLPAEPFPSDSKVLGTVSGWGRVSCNSFLSKVLKKATFKIMNRNQCQTRHKQKLYDGQICAVGEKGVGICKGDSGGPLVVNNTLIGVSSWNIPCATGVPDVFTDVYEFRNFIKEIIKSK